MTKAKHTPGSWRADFGEAFHIRPNDGCTLAQVTFLKGRGGLSGRRDAEEVAANARLIAAAPDLLEALEFLTTLVNILPNGTFFVKGQYITVEDEVRKARAVIAKAKGE